MKNALIILLGLFLFVTLFSLTENKINSAGSKIDLDGRISVISSPEAILTIEQILAEHSSLSYRPIQGHYINLAKNHSLWLKIDLRSLHLENLNGYVLQVQRNNVRRPAEVYFRSAMGLWQNQQLIDKSQYRNSLLTNFSENLKSDYLYLRLNGNYLRASINLFNGEGFMHQIQRSALYDGLYYGMLLLFIVFNLILYSRLKQKAYLAYSALLSSIFLLFASGQGWLIFLFPESVIVQNIPTNILGMLLAISSAEFARQYMQLKILSAKLNQILSTLQIVVLTLLVGKLTLNDYLPSAIYFIAYGVGLLAILLIFIGCIAGAVIGLRQKKREAWYYLSATFVFFVTAIIMGLSAGDLIKVEFSWKLLQAASVLEFLIFSAGLLGIYQRQTSEKLKVEEKLQLTQAKLVKQLEFSNSLKDNILTNVVDPKLFTELAKIVKILPDVRFVKSLGNDCLVVYKEKNQRRETELECNLQNLADSFGDKHFLRVHKSYLINPQHNYSLKRRTSADYDLVLLGEVIPVGRKFLSQVKALA